MLRVNGNYLYTEGDFQDAGWNLGGSFMIFRE